MMKTDLFVLIFCLFVVAHVIRSDAMAGVAIDCHDYDMPSEAESLWDNPRKSGEVRAVCGYPDEAVVEGEVTINVFYDASRDGTGGGVNKGWYEFELYKWHDIDGKVFVRLFKSELKVGDSHGCNHVSGDNDVYMHDR